MGLALGIGVIIDTNEAAREARLDVPLLAATPSAPPRTQTGPPKLFRRKSQLKIDVKPEDRVRE